jgi:hypothetical protein
MNHGFRQLLSPVAEQRADASTEPTGIDSQLLELSPKGSIIDLESFVRIA